MHSEQKLQNFNYCCSQLKWSFKILGGLDDLSKECLFHMRLQENTPFLLEARFDFAQDSDHMELFTVIWCGMRLSEHI